MAQHLGTALQVLREDEIHILIKHLMDGRSGLKDVAVTALPFEPCDHILDCIGDFALPSSEDKVSGTFAYHPCCKTSVNIFKPTTYYIGSVWL
jgi:hypothetical protein